MKVLHLIYPTSLNTAYPSMGPSSHHDHDVIIVMVKLMFDMCTC